MLQWLPSQSSNLANASYHHWLLDIPCWIFMKQYRTSNNQYRMMIGTEPKQRFDRVHQEIKG
jgi:hypothetical protein